MYQKISIRLAGVDCNSMELNTYLVLGSLRVDNDPAKDGSVLDDLPALVARVMLNSGRPECFGINGKRAQ